MEEGDESRQEAEDGPALNDIAEGIGADPDRRFGAGSADRGALAVMAAALVVTVFRNRAWATPNLGFFTAIADNLGRNPFPKGFDGDYLLTNVTGPALARLVGATAPHLYVRLHLAALVLGVGVVLGAVWRRWGSTVSATLAVVIAAAPAMTTTLQWLGQPDAFTFPLALGLAVTTRRTTAIALAVALGCTHAEQGVVIATVAGVARMVVDLEQRPSIRGWFRAAAPLVAGVVAGGLGVRLWFVAFDLEVRRSRASFLDLGPRGFWDHHLQGGLWLPLALWGLLWIPLAAMSWTLRRKRLDETSDLRVRWLWLIGAAAAAVLPIAVTLDETRVYAMATAPLLPAAVIIGVLVDRGKTVLVQRRVAVVALLVIAVVPGFFTAGERYGSWSLPPGEFTTFLRDGTHPGDLTPWLLGPFGFDVPSSND